MKPLVVAVGTTHPFAATGMLLELAAIRRLDALAGAVVAGVSAQDATRVLARYPLPAQAIEAQFVALEHAPVRAFSVGALLDAPSVSAVAEGLKRFPNVPVVCDPVIAASGGDRLADDATLAAMQRELFPLCTLITPNVPEAAYLLGRSIEHEATARAALEDLRAFGAQAVLLKGGHLAGDPCDFLSDGGRVTRLHASRLPQELRGTGSLLAAAIAVGLARGADLLSAINAAREVVRACIADGIEIAGMRVAF